MPHFVFDVFPYQRHILRRQRRRIPRTIDERPEGRRIPCPPREYASCAEPPPPAPVRLPDRRRPLSTKNVQTMFERVHPVAYVIAWPARYDRRLQLLSASMGLGNRHLATVRPASFPGARGRPCPHFTSGRLRQPERHLPQRTARALSRRPKAKGHPAPATAA